MSLEGKLIAYAVTFILFVLTIGWGVHTVDSWHYDSLTAATKDAQNQLVQQQQQRVIDAQAAQKKAEDNASQMRANLDATNTVARDATLGSLRDVQAAVHALAVSATVGNSGAVPGRSAGTGGNNQFADAVRNLDAAAQGVDDAVGAAITAAQHDSANYSSIRCLAPQSKTLKGATLPCH